MSDKNKGSSAARQAGRGFGRLLEKLLGRDRAGRLAESADVLRREFEAGKHESEEPPPRSIPHREVDSKAALERGKHPGSEEP